MAVNRLHEKTVPSLVLHTEFCQQAPEGPTAPAHWLVSLTATFRCWAPSCFFLPGSIISHTYKGLCRRAAHWAWLLVLLRGLFHAQSVPEPRRQLWLTQSPGELSQVLESVSAKKSGNSKADNYSGPGHSTQKPRTSTEEFLASRETGFLDLSKLYMMEPG
jgi:hypothetical protein